MIKVKTRKLHNHIFNVDCMMVDIEDFKFSDFKGDCTLTNDEMGTTLSIILNNRQQLMIPMKTIFKKLGIAIELGE